MISTTYPPYPARYTSRTWTSMPPSHGLTRHWWQPFLLGWRGRHLLIIPGWREEWCRHFIHFMPFHDSCVGFSYIYLMDPRVFSFHLLLAKFIRSLWNFLSVSIEAWLGHPTCAQKVVSWRWSTKWGKQKSKLSRGISGFWVEQHPRLFEPKTTRSATDLESIPFLP